MLSRDALSVHQVPVSDGVEEASALPTPHHSYLWKIHNWSDLGRDIISEMTAAENIQLTHTLKFVSHSDCISASPQIPPSVDPSAL